MHSDELLHLLGDLQKHFWTVNNVPYTVRLSRAILIDADIAKFFCV